MTKFSWLNWIDAPDCIVTADAEAGELVGLNLKRKQSSSAWRTLITEEADEAGVTFDLGRVRTIGCLLLAFTRNNDPTQFDAVPSIHPTTDTIRHRLSAVAPGDGEAYDSGVIASGVDPAFGYHYVLVDPQVSARWWRVDIEAASRVTQGYLDVVRAWAGPVFSPSVSFSYGDNAGWNAAADITRARRGLSEFGEASEATQAWSMTFEGITDDERETVDDFERHVTAAQQFLIVRNDRTAARAAMLARQVSASGQDSLTWRRNRKTMRLVENL